MNNSNISSGKIQAAVVFAENFKQAQCLSVNNLCVYVCVCVHTRHTNTQKLNSFISPGNDNPRRKTSEGQDSRFMTM